MYFIFSRVLGGLFSRKNQPVFQGNLSIFYRLLINIELTLINLVNRSDGQVVDVPGIWRRRLGLITESIKLTQVAIDLPLIQPCTMRFSARRVDEHCQLVRPILI